MTFFSIRFARLAALSLLLTTAGCTINTYESSEPSSGGEEPKEDKPKPKKKKKKKKPAEEKPEAKPEKPKDDKPKDDKPKPEKPKDDKPKDDGKPASKPDKPKDEPVVEKPKEDKPADKPAPATPDKPDKPAPQPEGSKIVLPIRIALDALEKEIDGLIPTTDKKDWAQITKGDDNPKADLKYELWRDPIKLELEGDTFLITVPVRYAATIRAQAKNPVTNDWFWIAKSETWGTKDEPQRITARFEAKLSVSEDWKIKSELKLAKISHGDPPSGQICKDAGVKVCVEKSSIADEVREGIDEKLEPKLKKALEKVEGKVEGAFDLKKRATAVWAAIQKPQALPYSNDMWFVARPTEAGVSPIAKDGKDVVVVVAIEGKLAVESGKKPKIVAVPLPKVSKVEGQPGIHVAADLRIPRAQLGASLEKALKAVTLETANKSKLPVLRAQVNASADPQRPNRFAVKLAFSEKAGEEVELQGDVLYDADRERLYIGDVDITPASREVATKLGLGDLKQLEREVESKARWDLNDEALPLKKLIAVAFETSLKGQAAVKGELKELDVQKLDVKPDTVEARVIVGGNLEVEVKR